MSRNAEEEASQTPEWQIIESLANEISDFLLGQMRKTRARIERVHKSYGVPLLGNLEQTYLDRQFRAKSIAVTDRPLSIFTNSGPLYTISTTSFLSQERPQLLPAELLHALKIGTHRGMGLSLFYSLLRTLGIGSANSEMFVWTSDKVDPEQVVLEQRIIEMGLKVDESLLDVLFQWNEKRHLESGGYDLNPKLIRLLNHLKNRTSPLEEQELSNYIDDLLETLHIYTGVREGWFVQLEQLLKGLTIPHYFFDPDDVMEDLLFTLEYISKSVEANSNLAIFEIDPKKLLFQEGVYFFPISSRPPNSLVPVTSVPVHAVTSIYSDSQKNQQNNAHPNIRTLPLDSLPINCWLSRDGVPQTPADVTARGIDPFDAICGLRYGIDPIAIWAHHLLEGNFLFYNEGRPNLIEKNYPQTHSDLVMIKCIEILLDQSKDENKSRLIAKKGREYVLRRVMSALHNSARFDLNIASTSFS